MMNPHEALDLIMQNIALRDPEIREAQQSVRAAIVESEKPWREGERTTALQSILEYIRILSAREYPPINELMSLKTSLKILTETLKIDCSKCVHIKEASNVTPETPDSRSA